MEESGADAPVQLGADEVAKLPLEQVLVHENFFIWLQDASAATTQLVAKGSSLRRLLAMVFEEGEGFGLGDPAHDAVKWHLPPAHFMGGTPGGMSFLFTAGEHDDSTLVQHTCARPRRRVLSQRKPTRGQSRVRSRGARRRLLLLSAAQASLPGLPGAALPDMPRGARAPARGRGWAALLPAAAPLLRLCDARTAAAAPTHDPHRVLGLPHAGALREPRAPDGGLCHGGPVTHTLPPREGPLLRLLPAF